MASDGQIAAVVLAAGASRRFGEDNKLLARFDDMALIEHVISALNEAGFEKIVVVTGWDRDGVERALAGRDVRFAHNPSWEAGMGGSIGTGIAALDEATRAALVLPGDMPCLGSRLVSALLAAFDAAGGALVVYPTTRDGEQRNPVVWPRRYFAALQALPPDAGAKAMLRQLACGERLGIPVGDDATLFDVDTPADLDAIGNQKRELPR